MAFARTGLTRAAEPYETAVWPGRSPTRKLLSELLSGRQPTTVKPAKEARNEYEFVVGPVGIEPTTSRL
jgi:hypothetical protein